MSRRREKYQKHKTRNVLSESKKKNLIKEYRESNILVKDLLIKYNISKQTLYNILDKKKGGNIKIEEMEKTINSAKIVIKKHKKETMTEFLNRKMNE